MTIEYRDLYGTQTCREVVESRAFLSRSAQQLASRFLPGKDAIKAFKGVPPRNLTSQEGTKTAQLDTNANVERALVMRGVATKKEASARSDTAGIVFSPNHQTL